MSRAQIIIHIKQYGVKSCPDLGVCKILEESVGLGVYPNIISGSKPFSYSGEILLPTHKLNFFIVSNRRREHYLRFFVRILFSDTGGDQGNKSDFHSL